jgi:CubicO group peptidase (beta-lactamase class C family)
MSRQARTPWIVATLSVVLVPIACAVAAAQTAAPAKSSKVAAALQPFVDDHALAGAVTLVANKDKVLALDAVGYADIAAGKPMRTDCLFWIASQSKPITAVALMMLVDEGKVSIDDPVEKYLPEFKGQWMRAEQSADQTVLTKPAHPITVKNVLTHTSGLPFKTLIEEPTLDLYPLGTRVRSYAMVALDFQPDTRFQYSNAGINTAGRIIEVVSGMPYEQFLDLRLFQPLGMKDTTFWPKGEQIERLAKAYKPSGKTGLEETPIGQLKYPLDDPERQPMPAGGLFSTAQDLSIFYRMVAQGGTYQGKHILSPESLKQMTMKQTGDLPQSNGLGFTTGGGRIGHGGAYGTNSSYDPEHNLITIFLVQHAGWTDEGKKILPTFQKTATELFGSAPVTSGADARTIKPRNATAAGS